MQEVCRIVMENENNRHDKGNENISKFIETLLFVSVLKNPFRKEDIT